MVVEISAYHGANPRTDAGDRIMPALHQRLLTSFTFAVMRLALVLRQMINQPALVLPQWRSSIRHAVEGMVPATHPAAQR